MAFLVVLFSFPTIYPKCMYRRHFLSKSSSIASFVEPLSYSIFKLNSVLILVFLFLFTSIHSKCVFKSQFFLNFQVLHERSSDVASYVKHLTYRIFIKYTDTRVFNLYCRDLPKYFFWKYQVLRERNSDVASFMLQPVHSILKV